jgi:chromosome segregation ATPase
MQQNRLLIIIIVIVLGVGGYFLWQNTVLNDQLANLKNEKSKVDTELAILKASDLAKEVQFLSFKLKTTEKSLSESEGEASRLGSRVQSLETNLNKIKPYLSAIDAVQKVITGETGITKASVANADPKVAVLKDSEISDHWRKAKDYINFDGDRASSYNQRFFGDAISTIISRIFSLIP